MNVMIINDTSNWQGAATTRSLADRAASIAPLVVAGIADLSVAPDGGVMASSHRLVPGDRVLVRTNPSRGSLAMHLAALGILSLAKHQGVWMINDPDTLLRAISKAYLPSLPADLYPRTLVSSDTNQVIRHIQDAPGRTVLKPSFGARGQDVFALDSGSANLRQIVESVIRQGAVLVQDFVPEAANGDTRVLVLGGKVLTVDGHVCAVRRIPPEDDFRSNIAVGARPAPAALSEQALEVARLAAEWLMRDGIHVAGLDIIGNKIIEANVFSPGGLPDAAKFEGVDFLAALIDEWFGIAQAG
jgi:glutathione synthase